VTKPRTSRMEESAATIVKVRCFSVRLPVAGRAYVMSQSRILNFVDTTVVELESADGTVGYGEACTLGSSYIEGFAGSTVAAVHELAPGLIGMDAYDANVLNRAMDLSVRGHLPAKAAIDAAGWDLRGKLLGMPVYKLLGGSMRDRYPIFHPVTLDTPAAMAEESRTLADQGYRHWQLKLGNDPLEDAARVHAVVEALAGRVDFLTSDANRGWTPAEAIRFARAVEDVDTYLEQPCPSLDELHAVRQQVRQPMIADEAVVTAADLLTCIRLGAAEAMNIKPARVGGLTKAARLRDLAQAAGFMLMVDDPMGGTVAMAGIAHLAVTCDPANLLAATHMASTHVDAAALAAMTGGPEVSDGWGRIANRPGLGVDVDPQRLGPAVFTVM